MPVRWVKLRTADAKSEEGKLRFCLPHGMIGAGAARYVADQRKQAIVRRDEMLGYQKSSADREGARFFKDQARDALKFYRAACLLLPWVEGDSVLGDCPLTDPYDWPAELFPALNLIAEGATLA